MSIVPLPKLHGQATQLPPACELPHWLGGRQPVGAGGHSILLVVKQCSLDEPSGAFPCTTGNHAKQSAGCRSTSNTLLGGQSRCREVREGS